MQPASCRSALCIYRQQVVNHTRKDGFPSFTLCKPVNNIISSLVHANSFEQCQVLMKYRSKRLGGNFLDNFVPSVREHSYLVKYNRCTKNVDEKYLWNPDAVRSKTYDTRCTCR